MAKSLSTKLARQMLEALGRRASADGAESSSRFFKEPAEFMGVRATDMHAVAKELFATVKSDLTPAAAIEVCELLLPDPRSEVKITALLFLGCIHKTLDADGFDAAEQWILAGWCESWAAIDTLGIYVLGPVLLRELQLVSKIGSWPHSPNLWLRRAAAVTLVKPARKGFLLDEIHQTVLPLLDDPEDLVQKAVGWLLRESGKPDVNRLLAFLNEHGSRCARTTLRYAIERLPSTDRSRILRETKKKS